MNNDKTMNEFSAQAKKNRALAYLIPMGFGAGFPILSVKNKKLCVIYPYFRTIKQLEKDKTLIYPIAFTATFLWPSGELVGFENLKLKKEFHNIDFSQPVGLFRHEAIKDLNHGQYDAKKEELYSLYDEMIACIYDASKCSQEQESKFKNLLNTLIEPSLKPFYKEIDEPFYNRFLI